MNKKQIHRHREQICGCVAIVAQSISRVQLFATPWTAARQAPLSFTASRSFLKLMFIELVMASNHLSSVAPFSCPQFFPASGAFSESQFFTQVTKVLELQFPQKYVWKNQIQIQTNGQLILSVCAAKEIHSPQLYLFYFLKYLK